jgi:exonuclease III
VHRNGGVAIFARTHLDIRPITVESVEKSCKCAGAKLIIDKVFYCIFTVYRSPDCDKNSFTDHLDSKMSSLTTKNLHNIIVCGDFNVNFSIENTKRTQLTVMISSYNLKPTILTPTQVTSNTESLIDNILVHKCLQYRYSKNMD